MAQAGMSNLPGSRAYRIIITELNVILSLYCTICDPPQDFNAKGESTCTTRFHFKTKEFILTRFSTLAILPH